MNDFTKEELDIIFYWAIDRLESVGIDFFREEGHDNLYEKIESMINNYCEHEKMNFVGDIFGYDCIKCGKGFTSQDIDSDRHSRIIAEEE